jgi:hypothetical protein
MKKLLLLLSLSLAIIILACKDDDESTQSQNDAPEVYKNIYGAADMYVEGDFVVIKSKGLPDHKSPYYTNANYEAYNGSNSNFQLNPNKISEQNYTFRIPLTPKEASNHAATPLGAIGISINGVPFFNQYAGPSQPLTNEINSFDQYNGHPQQTGQYHYHMEPLYLSSSKGKSALMGFLLDGFPVYGPTENGAPVTTAMLDAYHGHSHSTADFPNGIYHYHITDDAPYINGDGFFGTAGSVSK